jgi:hypothetical protein
MPAESVNLGNLRRDVFGMRRGASGTLNILALHRPHSLRAEVTAPKTLASIGRAAWNLTAVTILESWQTMGSVRSVEVSENPAQLEKDSLVPCSSDRSSKRHRAKNCIDYDGR